MATETKCCNLTRDMVQAFGVVGLALWMLGIRDLGLGNRLASGDIDLEDHSGSDLGHGHFSGIGRARTEFAGSQS